MARWCLVELTFSCERVTAWSGRASTAFARPSILVALVAVLAPVCLILLRSTLHATVNTITVNTLADPGTSTQCSLRAALLRAHFDSQANSN